RSACATGSRGRGGCAAERNRVDAIPLSKEERAAIARNAQVRDAATKAAATAAGIVRRRWSTRGNSRQTLTVFLNRIDNRRRRHAGRLSGNENNRTAV